MNAEKISAVCQAMIDYYSGDPKRIQHFMKVHAFAKLIAEKENLSENEVFVIEIAALVHDIGIKNAEIKYHSSMGKYQEKEGPSEAKKLLEALNIDAQIIDRVCYLVGHHHTYKAIDGIDYQILVEADFLVNIYEDSLPQSSAISVLHKIFKTKSGIKLLRTIYAFWED